MKKYEILYDWPIDEIRRLADSDSAEQYSISLAEPELSIFVGMTERMRNFGVELVAAKASRTHYQNWIGLYECVKEFGDSFPGFPAPSVDRLKLSILLSEKVSQSAPQLTDDIDTNLFELRELSEPLPLVWFCRENRNSLVDSVAVFSCVEFTSVSNEIAAASVSEDFLFHLIASVHSSATIPASLAVLIKKATPQLDASATNAFVRLAVLATGKPVHSALRFSNPPSVIDPDSIRPGASYQQWGDVLHVLSEYNSREEVLLKFLTIYHVVENFMFRRPIVELERQRNGAMFSIRDFRRLYDGISINEVEALKRLFEFVFRLPASGNNTFSQHISSQWNGLVPSTLTASGVDTVLETIGIKYKFQNFATNEFSSNYAALVYRLRCAIVHNKETEFHLTYATMNQTICDLFVSFLLPTLEQICFALISTPNPLLWYQNKELQLYG